METFSMVVLGGEYVTIYCWRPGVPTCSQIYPDMIFAINTQAVSVTHPLGALLNCHTWNIPKSDFHYLYILFGHFLGMFHVWQLRIKLLKNL